MLFKTLSRHNLLLHNVLIAGPCFYLRVGGDESVCCHSPLAPCHAAPGFVGLSIDDRCFDRPHSILSGGGQYILR